jgi:uncharacterized caspase-like protein
MQLSTIGRWGSAMSIMLRPALAALAMLLTGQLPPFADPVYAGANSISNSNPTAKAEAEAERMEERHRHNEKAWAKRRKLKADAEVIRTLRTYYPVVKEMAEGLFEPLVEYESQPDIAGCDQRHAPETYAILIGVSDIGSTQYKANAILKGSENDVDLLETLLKDRGVNPSHVHKLAAKDATRRAVADAMETVLASVKCEDRVLFHYSGFATTADNILAAILYDDAENGKASKMPSLAGNREETAYRIEGIVDRISKLSFGALGGVTDMWNDLAVLRRHEMAFLTREDRAGHYGLFLGSDISDFMIEVRNRGAHAVSILDSARVAESRIALLQRQADSQSIWQFKYDVKTEPQDRTPALVPGHGSYTVFYAADVGQGTPELPLPKGKADARKYGRFTFAIANALLENARATPRTIAEAIQRAYSSEGRRVPQPVVESSEPDLVLVAEVAPPRGEPIKILSPAQYRGASPIETADIDIEGYVDWPSPALGVFVDDADVPLDRGGRFRQSVKLKPGLNVVNVRAVTADNRLHRKTIELFFDGDKQAIAGKGRRYALVIANQNYGPGTGMPSLTTPIADAAAIAGILTDKYGFETRLELSNGRTLPLTLIDPTKHDIEYALFQVGKVATAEDAVLIFYAGHGVFEPITSNAYWVPADAEVGYQPSYLSAADISAAVQRIQAKSLILISDSCYSGSLLRGGEAEDEKIDDADRTHALLKLQSERSRILITSGNNEPVADAGGGGHSIFAKALLTGLEKADHDAFSARELFDGYILQQVTANADQEPQFRPLEKVGHEGGDFVFVKSIDGEQSTPAPVVQR